MAKRNAPRPSTIPWSPPAILLVTALVAAALLLYWNSLRYPRVFDDFVLSIGSMRQYAAGWITLAPRWLAVGSFGWIHQVLGPDWLLQRLFNVLVHAGVAAMLFLFLRRLFAIMLPGKDTWPTWYAFAGACFFLVHPAAVYGVAYLVQRSIAMATLFGLVSLWFFMEGLLRGKRWWLLASAAAYFAAVSAKEHAVMIPAVALALAVLLREISGTGPKALARSLMLPMGLYAAIAVLVTLRYKGLLGTPYELHAETVLRELVASDPVPAATAASLEGKPIWALSIVNQGLLFFRYLATWLLPLPGWMSVDLRTVFPDRLFGWPHAAGFAAWLVWPLATGALLLRGGRAGLAGFALLASWLLSLTEMSTVRLQEPFVLYRSYLWMCLLPAAAPAILWRMPPLWRAVLLTGACLALLPSFHDRLATFSSEIGLWDDAVRKLPEPRPAYASRAVRNRGIAYFRAERLSEAQSDFDEALRLDPHNAASWIARGSLDMRLGQNERAVADFDRAIEIGGNLERYRMMYAQRCRALARLGRSDDALADCLKAVQVDPGAANSHISLGMVWASRGDLASAERAYVRALEIDPGYGVARYQYGLLLNVTGRAEEARRMLAQACASGLQEACADARKAGAPR